MSVFGAMFTGQSSAPPRLVLPSLLGAPLIGRFRYKFKVFAICCPACVSVCIITTYCLSLSLQGRFAFRRSDALPQRALSGWYSLYVGLLRGGLLLWMFFFCFQCLPLFASPLPVFAVLVVRCANQRVNVGTWVLQVFVCGAIVSLAHFHL